jgi:hypothetical protein
MNEFLAKFDAGQLIALVAVGGGLLCGIICGTAAIIMDYWHKIRRTETAAALKQDMLNRGMSADEIRIVMDAGFKRSKKDLGSPSHA